MEVITLVNGTSAITALHRSGRRLATAETSSPPALAPRSQALVTGVFLSDQMIRTGNEVGKRIFLCIRRPFSYQRRPSLAAAADMGNGKTKHGPTG
jgi:hypothetical protein